MSPIHQEIVKVIEILFNNELPIDENFIVSRCDEKFKSIIQQSLIDILSTNAISNVIAYCKDILEAYNRAYQTDPTSAFGGIIAFNRELDEKTATEIVERQFVEVIIAPKVSPEAQEVVKRKKNVRLLECGEWTFSLSTESESGHQNIVAHVKKVENV